MRPTPNLRIEALRAEHPMLAAPGEGVGEDYGYFELRELRIISSGSEDGTGWEHVSVSCEDRCPSWDEMQEVKELFWGDDETVVQFHPRASEYVNCFPYCLHLWKRAGHEYLLPPGWMIGPKRG